MSKNGKPMKVDGKLFHSFTAGAEWAGVNPKSLYAAITKNNGRITYKGHEFIYPSDTAPYQDLDPRGMPAPRTYRRAPDAPARRHINAPAPEELAQATPAQKDPLTRARDEIEALKREFMDLKSSAWEQHQAAVKLNRVILALQDRLSDCARALEPRKGGAACHPASLSGSRLGRGL